MRQVNLAALSAAAISVGVALAVFGLRIGNPFDLSWIDGDTLTSQFGWEEYRTDPRHFFPIISDRYSHPLPMPLAMFDNLPIIALLVKPVAQYSSAPVQYFGPMFLIGIALQALFALLLLKEATRGKSGTAYELALLLGTLFFATAPILLVRFYLSHMSLSLQWPLIAALWLYARSNRVTLRTSLRDWAILEFAASSINPYIMVMTLMVYSGFVLKCLISKALRWKNIMFFLIPLLIGALALIASGFMNPLGGGIVPGPGYGFFSANLYSPFNPMKSYLGSSILPDLKTSTAGQYEGFGYLGFGVILLLAGSLVYARIKGDNGDGLFPPLLVVVFIAYLLALSAMVSFGVYSFPVGLPQILFDILSVFRSSGRFIWVVEYCLLFIGIASLIRQLQPRYAAAILALAATLQVIDLTGPLAAMHRRVERIQGSNHFTDAAYLGLGKSHDTLVVLPAYQCESWITPEHDYPWPMFIPFANLAMTNHLRTNSFYGGRTPLAQEKYHCVTYPAALMKAPADRRTAYLLSAPAFARYGAHIAETHFCDFAEQMVICRADKGQAGLSDRARLAVASPSREADFAPSH